MDAPAHQSLGWHLWQVPTTQKPASFDERMSNIEFHTNDVNGPGDGSENVASGRCPVDQQRRPCTSEQRQKRLGWSKEADQVRQIKNKEWLETVEQEEIAIRVGHEHQEIENTELHATDKSSSSSSSWYPSKTSKIVYSTSSLVHPLVAKESHSRVARFATGGADVGGLLRQSRGNFTFFMALAFFLRFLAPLFLK